MEKLIAYTEARSVAQLHTRCSAPICNVVKPRVFIRFPDFAWLVQLRNSPVASAGRRHYSPRTNSNRCLQIQTLFQVGHECKFIAEFLNLSYRQVTNNIANGIYGPKKSSARTRKISQSRVDELEAYVRSTKEARQMSYTDLAVKFAHWGVGAYAIKARLKKEAIFGFCLGLSPL
ncbi:hypothetical protein K3495_g11569 [Podosphaera aphanis]|nr:hypothetical protein K3495_g11569 [Podosphaera aphanis]